MFEGDAIALIDRQGALTYDELVEFGDRLTESIEDRSLVFVLTSNTMGAIAGYAAFVRKRIVVLMLRPDIPAELFHNLVEAYRPQHLWMPEDAVEKLGIDTAPSFGAFGYQLHSTGYPRYDIHPELAVLLTTSGSTGSPKFVRLSYENILSNARSIAEYQKITPADRAITTLPASYTYGLSIVNSHLMSGASIALIDEGILSPAFWSFLAESHATNFGGVPYTYQMLARLKFERRDLPSLRFISQAGGRLGVDLHEKFARICADKGVDFIVMYGQTEATARMSWLPPEHALDKVGSIGIAIPGGEFEVRSLEDGSSVTTPHVSGELVYKGPNVSLGYAHGAADLALGDERGGELSTGDVAYFDEDGYYYISGRLKRFLKVFGNRVSLDELEALLEHEGWTCAAHGEDNRLAVSTTSADVDAIKAFLKDTTGLHPSAFVVRQVEEIPHTSAGKVDYTALNASLG